MPAPENPPLAPAIRASASVLMVRDGGDGLEVFMIQRHDRSDVHGGAYVFPGGKVDAADAAPELQDHLDLPPAALRERLHEPELDEAQATALHVAAVREAFEECGVLFARAQGAPSDAPAPAGTGFNDRVLQQNLRLDVGALQPWSRWITPENSVSSPGGRRFDTRFFLAVQPAGQQAAHDNHEAVHSVWLRPRTALERYWAREIAMAPPQIMSLSHLSRHASVAALWADAAARPPYLVRPHVGLVDGLRVLAYPGDPLHAERVRVMPGPLRLLVRNGRFEPAGGFGAFCD
jgi:8-oxo-dGTP pyrophosphatase MutT (NUDIX family)